MQQIKINGTIVSIPQAVNQAIQLFQSGHQKPAELIYEAIKQLALTDPDDLLAMSQISHVLAHYQITINCLEKLLRLSPENTTIISNLGSALHQIGRQKEAKKYFKTALDISPNDADIWNNLGLVHKALEEYKDAKLAFRKAASLEPKNYIYQAALSESSVLIGDLETAEKAIKQAIVLERSNPYVQNVLEKFCAKKSYEQNEEEFRWKFLINLLPNDEIPFVKLSDYYEMRNRYEEAQKVAIEGLAKADEKDSIRLSLTRTLFRQKQYGDAEKEINKININKLSVTRHIEYHFDYANLLNKMQNETEALKYYTLGNQLADQKWSNERKGQIKLLPLESIENTYKNNWIDKWQSENDWQEKSEPVFFFGFPRSGTTLLERVLDTHSQIKTISEQGLLEEVINQMGRDNKAYPEYLPKIDKEYAEKLRDKYFRELKKHSEKGKLSIDKMPLDTMHIGLVKQLFPKAKIIFAIRHPYDSCLSCYMQNFKMTVFMAYFTSLKNTGKFYNQIMQLWQHFNSIFQLNTHEIRYENLVTNFKDEVNRVLNFLDLSWEESQESFYENKSGVFVETPSYHQVNEPLYREVEHRWKRYPTAVKELKPMVEKWVKHYNY